MPFIAITKWKSIDDNHKYHNQNDITNQIDFMIENDKWTFALTAE